MRIWGSELPTKVRSHLSLAVLSSFSCSVGVVPVPVVNLLSVYFRETPS